jgi:hypothetical protein
MMNMKSGAPGEAMETLNLHHRQVRLWFIDWGGKEKV